MIILKVRYRTPHTATQTSTRKKRVEKERQQKKATSIKQRKAILALSCLVIYILFHPLKKHKANRRFWGSKYRKIFTLQGLEGKQRLWRHRWVVAIVLYSGGSRPSDKGRGGRPVIQTLRQGGGGWFQKFFPALWARPQVWSKIRGGPGLPRLLCIATICNSNDYNILLWNLY